MPIAADWQFFMIWPVPGYTIQVTTEIPYQDTTLILRGTGLAKVYGPQSKPDTVGMIISFSSSLVINEIYYCGPVNRAFYFYDQFVELYNISVDTVYLDGMLVARSRQDQHVNMETNDFVPGHLPLPFSR